ncbi:MAG: helix-turn-helix transcriptional regulator [Clostridia bacterium]|nr:helix-turn-helix transcriptional regulator [Clostridia bacterium]
MMINLGETIARLRKERGITQETLAECMGVTAQTISKWENSATCPDVMLLPVLADFFGVTVDDLYGRCGEEKLLSREEAGEAAMAQIRRIIVRCFYGGNRKADVDELAEELRTSLKDGVSRSVIQSGNGSVIYMREPVGTMVIKRPEQGWNSLFTDENSKQLLQVLADDAFRKAMTVILKKRMLTFTIPALSKMAEVQDSDHLEQMVKESCLFACKTLAIDESTITYYELTQGEQKLYLLYAALLFVQEYAQYRAHHRYFSGDMDYFTP